VFLTRGRPPTRRHTTETTEQDMDKPDYDPAEDPIPDDLTEEEKNAVRRQGEFLAWQRSVFGDQADEG
jgi:hypothetical protein